ncbi:MAG: helix-turn-helix domain-containing protein [Nitrososphaerota archaeon]
MAVVAGLRKRRSALEEIAEARIWKIGARPLDQHTDYAQGLRLAIAAALEFGIHQIESIDVEGSVVPEAVLTQARAAAQHEIGLETVLRRYVAGYSVFVDCLMEEAARCSLGRSELQRIVAEETIALDLLLAAVSAEHEETEALRRRGAEGRRVQRLRRLLDGELVAVDDLNYPFGGYNLAVVALGSEVEQHLRRVAKAIDRAVLTVRVGEERVWGWLGGQRAFTRMEHQAISSLVRGDGETIGLGEPCVGLDGWRLSHRQARAALGVAESTSETMVRYGDVAVVASAQRDRLLALSLQEIYLKPLAEGRDGGAKSRATLRAYIDAGRNVSSTAAALGVSRRTVTKRIQDIEDKLGRPIALAIPALDTALRLQALTGGTDPSFPSQ